MGGDLVVKDELVRVTGTTMCARKAQIAVLLRFAGGVAVTAGTVVVDAEVDHEPTARRLPRDLWELYGCKAAVRVMRPAGGESGHRFVVRVSESGEDLARQSGLIDRRGRPIIGLPAHVVAGSIEDTAAVWRGAILARGTLSTTGRSRGLEVVCPGPEAALALAGAARRLGVSARAREVRGVDRVVLRDREQIAALLERIGAPQARTEWITPPPHRDLRGLGSSTTLDNTNRQRSAEAALKAVARVQRAFDILGEDVPDQLWEAGRLRIAHPAAALGDLGRLADPPLSKDAVAGRIRRLLALADRQARRAGLPDTTAITTNGV